MTAASTHSALTDSMLAAVETELRKHVGRFDSPATRPFHEMLAYHLGWATSADEAASPGKRIRPLLLLLTNAACGGEWQHALPAAAAFELIHNFSLVHDDIQDASETRRGRVTVWRRWGAPMAINVGDALFVLSSSAILDLGEHHAADIVVEAARVLHDGTLEITRGQYLDLAYEDRADLAIEEYWTMIAGKTAALLAASARLGALLAGVEPAVQELYRLFAHHLGLAFQVQDDILGIWGDEALTGKSTASDLVARKKSLPILLGLEKGAGFAKRWAEGPITEAEAPRVAEMLAADGARQRADSAGREQMQKAMDHLARAGAVNEAGQELGRLARALVDRKA